MFLPAPPQPQIELWRQLTLLDTLIYKMTYFLQVDTPLFWMEDSYIPGSCIPLLISDLHRFFLQAIEKENTECPLYHEQRRQHGHLQTSSKYKFMGCPFSPLVSSQGVQGYSQNISSVCLSLYNAGSF